MWWKVLLGVAVILVVIGVLCLCPATAPVMAAIGAAFVKGAAGSLTIAMNVVAATKAIGTVAVCAGATVAVVAAPVAGYLEHKNTTLQVTNAQLQQQLQQQTQIATAATARADEANQERLGIAAQRDAAKQHAAQQRDLVHAANAREVARQPIVTPGARAPSPAPAGAGTGAGADEEIPIPAVAARVASGMPRGPGFHAPIPAPVAQATPPTDPANTATPGVTCRKRK